MYLKTDSKRRLLVVSCAGLDMKLAGRSPLSGLLDWHPLHPVFPAVTCTAQATLRTGLAPVEHGVLANGRYDRCSSRVEFWGQSCGIMPEKRIWEGLRARGGRAAVMFHQQSLGDTVDFTVSPAPVHRHGGGIVEALYCRPPELEEALREMTGGSLRLAKYWGPMASASAGGWCAAATAALMERHAPELLLTYLPDMDYVLQREGPDGESVQRELEIFSEHVLTLLEAADRFGYAAVFWGDYSVCPVSRPVYPNRILAEAGLFALREVGGRLYPNLYDSAAFAMVDHQVAHVFGRNREALAEAAVLFSGVPGIWAVLTPEEAGLAHGNCGELVLVAEKDSWFAYHWWEDSVLAPDYANHVDIHSKIGYDPCELFWGFPFFRTSLDCRKVRGSHGLADVPAAFAATGWAECFKDAGSLQELAVLIEKEV